MTVTQPLRAASPDAGQRVTVVFESSGYFTQSLNQCPGTQGADKNQPSITVPFEFECEGEKVSGQATIVFPAGPFSGTIDSNGNLLLDSPVEVKRSARITGQKSVPPFGFLSRTLSISGACSQETTTLQIEPTPKDWLVEANCRVALLTAGSAGKFHLSTEVKYQGGPIFFTSGIGGTYSTAAAPPAFSFAPAEVAFNAEPGGPDPSPQPVTLQGGGQEALNWRATLTTEDGGNWLRVTPSEGVVAANQPAQLSVSTETIGLAKGTYRGTIQITATSGGPVTVALAGWTAKNQQPGTGALPVTLVVADPVDPNQSVFTAGDSDPKRINSTDVIPILVRALDSAGKPVPNKPVELEFIRTCGSVADPVKRLTLPNTEANGESRLPLDRSSHVQPPDVLQPGEYSYTAKVGGTPLTTTHRRIWLGRADARFSMIAPDKSEVWANNVDELSVQVQLRDACDHKLRPASVALSFRVGNGPEVRRIPASTTDPVFTDANGEARFDRIKFETTDDYIVDLLVVGETLSTDQYLVTSAQVRAKAPPKVESFEVVQAIRLPAAEQTRYLVQNKDTVIRIVVRNQDRSPAEVEAYLELSAGGQSRTLSPDGSPKRILAPGIPSALVNLNSTFNFLVPSGLVGSSLSFRARLDPPSKLEETMPVEDLSFQQRRLNIKYVEVDVAGTPFNQAMLSAAPGLLRRLYPITHLGYAPLDGRVRPMTRATFADGDGVNPFLGTILAGTSANQHPDILFGWVNTGGCQGSGYFRIDPPGSQNIIVKARAAYGPLTPGCSQKVLAHEVAHDFLFGHPAPPSYPTLLHGPLFIEDLGIEVPPTGVLRARLNARDVMNQDDPAHGVVANDATVWVSRFFWTNMFTRLPGSPTALHSRHNSHARVRSAEAPPGGPGHPLLLIRGATDESGQAVLAPIFPALASLPAAEGGTDCLRLENASGQPLLTYCFSPEGPMEGTGPGTPTQFVETVPRPEGLARVVWLRNDLVVASRQMSAHAPALNIVSPSAGETWSGDGTLRWTAQDGDGDSLTYLIQYSPDDRQSWILLEADLPQTQFALNTGDLPGGERFWFRVVATDGLSATVAETGPIRVPNKAPRVLITSPQEGALIPTSATLAVEAEGYDLEDGPFPEDAFDWISDRAGALGTGRQIRIGNLAEGAHHITVRVQDKNGLQAQASIMLRVGETGDSTPTLGRTAGASLHCLSLRFPPLQGTAFGESFELRLTSLSSEEPANGELFPEPGGDSSSYTSGVVLSSIALSEPAEGLLWMEIPELGDRNRNGLDDFLEVSLDVPTTTTVGDYSSDFDNGRVTAVWTRPAGSSVGTCQLHLSGLISGLEADFSSTFELIEYVGPLSYEVAGNGPSGSLQLQRAPTGSTTISGPVQFSRVSNTALVLEAGSWVNSNGQKLEFDQALLEGVPLPANGYAAEFLFVDGDPGTVAADFLTWILLLKDPNDADHDGVADLSDTPAAPPAAAPVFTRIHFDQTGVVLAWTGLGQLQSAPSIKGPWANEAVSQNPLRITLKGRMQFFRVIAP